MFDEPDAVLIDTAGLLVVRYGFRVYALEARSGELRWSYASSTPTVALLASARLDHVVLQTELETIALRPTARSPGAPRTPMSSRTRSSSPAGST